MKDVVLLTTNTCPYCKMAKEFLNQNKIHFVEKDVNHDFGARQEMTKRKLTGVPVFLIGGDAVVGLDREKVLKLVDHRLQQCPGCKASVRVPVNEGKIKAKCPKCKTELK